MPTDPRYRAAMRSAAGSTKAVGALEAIAALADDPPDALEFLDEMRRRVDRIVPAGGGAWMLTDPETAIPTAAVKPEDVDPELGQQFFEHELTVPDISGFSELHHTGTVVTTLHHRTGGRPELSHRFREIHTPYGLGDEVRMLFRTGPATWGMACMSRYAGEPVFDDLDREWLRRAAPHIGRGIRTAFARPPAEPEPRWAPGMLVVDERGAVEYATGEAHRWLAQLRDGGIAYGELPAPVMAVAMQARAEALAGGPVFDAPAQARVRTSGGWLYIHAAVMRDARGEQQRIAVMLEPADRAQLLPLLSHVHGLTDRERQVTELLVGGLATDEIAARMAISRHTLRDHVKAIFAKVGVASRPELTARFLPGLD